MAQGEIGFANTILCKTRGKELERRTVPLRRLVIRDRYGAEGFESVDQSVWDRSPDATERSD
jgi:hypothetical protein